MTDPKAFYKTLMADTDTHAFIKTLKDKAESYGEDKDKFLSYMLSIMVSLYTSTETMIANIETVKMMLLLSSIEHGFITLQDAVRENDKSVAAKPV